MIRTLILYYLSIKSTHGYEIQRFIQLNQMDEWTKIQSGSIYYALGKLEKQGAIEIVEVIGTGKKARKIYAITEAGKRVLEESVKDELNSDITTVGSDKFIIYPLLKVLNKENIIGAVTQHIHGLQKKLSYMEHWRDIKINESSLKVEKIAFEMMIQQIRMQVEWHNALIEELDSCIAESETIARIIEAFDFSVIDDKKYQMKEDFILSHG